MQSKAVEEPGTTPDVQKPKKASKKKSVATNADSIHESQVEGKSGTKTSKSCILSDNTDSLQKQYLAWYLGFFIFDLA